MKHPDTTTLEGQIAVMQAAKEGKKIENKLKVHDDTWTECDPKYWNWVTYDYRIAPPAIAPGHNPHKLTVDQIPAGRKLMTEEEVRRGVDHPKIRERSGIWCWDGKEWNTDAYWRGNSTEATYCVPLDWVDPLLPKPKRTVPWSCPEDVPGPVCYLRLKNRTDGWGLIHTADWEGLKWGRTGGCDWSSVTLFEHSTDRKTWLPCTKEVEA